MILADGKEAVPERRRQTRGKGKKQMDAVVEEITACAERMTLQKARPLWLPPLGRRLYASEIRAQTRPEELVMGLADDPQNQRQLPFTITPGNGAIAVCGRPGSGKSTFLQTFLEGLLFGGADRVRGERKIYVFNYSGAVLSGYRGHPGVRWYLDRRSAPEEIRAVFDEMLTREMISGGALVIDDFGCFRECTDGFYDEELLRLLRETAEKRSVVAVSAGGFGFSDIPVRMAEFFPQTFSLEQTDSVRYMEILRQTHIEIFPEKNIPGRGLAVSGGRVLEFQTALSGNCPAAEKTARKE
jgi:S-DNA-T family DNA segregation ATPase FtsK/SpoIIIE